MSAIIKKIIFWNYGRSTWQYDVLCALILAFIFLTPKSWFASELTRPVGHQNPTAANTLLLTLPKQATPAPPDMQEIDRRARQLAAEHHGHVRAVRPIADETGTVIAYWVDIDY